MEELNFDVNALASELGGYLEKLTDEQKFAYDQIISVVSGLKEGSPLARLITKAKLIIWDEAPMISKYCYEALDKCLRDILRCSDSYNAHLPFGGKVVVLGGDFRQILPVIPRGSRQDIIQFSINSLYLWHNCKVLKLTKNIKLSLDENNNVQELRNFAEWLLKIGDGLAGDTTDGESIVHIPSDILVKNSETALDDLIDFVYPDMLSKLSVENYFKDRAILAPTLNCVIDVNNKKTAGLPGQERVYLSFDSVCAKEGNMKFELDAFSIEILNRINCSGLSPHKLVVKVGAPVMLLRNIDQTNGLCNGSRMQVIRMENHVIECKTLTGNKVGSIVLIPRLNLIPNNETLPIRVMSKDGLRVLLQDHGHLEDSCTMNVFHCCISSMRRQHDMPLDDRIKSYIQKAGLAIFCEPQ
ncbi:uncharacterized protein LOC107468041 [Arachis duranensis]|uniref:ATP-dependent DNA helicase n=1 Tax=Arachis duranensis TaxID=130453 RepID=A0A6P4BTA6_ARADU|nr:uncharacterized protein LOC107468041 [Arachis duranensis]